MPPIANGREMPGQDSDLRLWRDAEAGHPRAFAEIVRAHADRVARLLVHLLGPRTDLEDLVQTVFLELCGAMPRFRGDSSLATFIGGITVHVASRCRRPSAWWRLRGEFDEAEVEAVGPNPEAALYSTEQMQRTRKALMRIRAPKREAFILWALEGMEPEQIAQATGASLSATRSRIFYAQKELQQMAHKDPYLKDLVSAKLVGEG